MKTQLLSTQDIDDFFDRGYLVIPDVFSTTEIRRAKEAMNRLYQKGQNFDSTTVFAGSQFVFSGESLHRVVWAGANEPYLLEIGEDPRITQRVSQLLGSKELDHIINQCHFKMPHDNVAFRFHQDSENRGYGTSAWKDLNRYGSYVQTVLCIDPMKEDNGPLMLYPHSCRHGHIGLDRGADLKNYTTESEPLGLTMKPGSMVLFGPYTVHGSSPNQSNESRFVLINGYAYPGANQKNYPGESGRLLKVRQPMS